MYIIEESKQLMTVIVIQGDQTHRLDLKYHLGLEEKEVKVEPKHLTLRFLKKTLEETVNQKLKEVNQTINSTVL